MEPIAIAVCVAAALGGVLVGALWGRLSGSAAARGRELQAEVDALVEQGERAQAERAALETELDTVRKESGDYRKQVVEHFYGTSEQLRSLTLQYRAVFDHLAEGARELCPESFAALQEGLQPAALDARAGGEDETAEEESPALETDPEPTEEPERPELSPTNGRGAEELPH